MRGGCAKAASLLQSGEQAVQGAVLAEEKDFVFATKIVVEIGGGEVRGRGNVAHAGFKKTARAKLAAGCAQNLKPSRQMAPAQAAVTVKKRPWSQVHSFFVRLPVSLVRLAKSITNEQAFIKRTTVHLAPSTQAGGRVHITYRGD